MDEQECMDIKPPTHVACNVENPCNDQLEAEEKGKTSCKMHADTKVLKFQNSLVDCTCQTLLISYYAIPYRDEH